MTSAVRPLACWVLSVALLGGAAVARGGPVEDKVTARELAMAGIAAEGAGDCKTAIQKLEKAEALYHAPPHLQHLARCYEKEGRIVEAAETWRKLASEQVPEGSPEPFTAAVAEAHEQLPKVEARLGRLQISSKEPYPELSVEVDGKVWPSAALDVARVIDPGSHVVRASAKGHVTQQQEVKVPEGGTTTFAISLVKVKVAPPPPPPPPVDEGRTARLVGLGGIIGGGVILLTGLTTGLVSRSKYNQLSSDCPNGRCPFEASELTRRTDSIRTLSTVTTVMLIAGPVLAAGGVAFVLVGSNKSSNSGMLQTSVGAGPGGVHVALSGTF